MSDDPRLTHQLFWQESGEERSALWRSEACLSPPKRVIPVDDQLTADMAYRQACEGTAMLWRGDYHNARQLMQAIARRIDRKPVKRVATVTEVFHQQRMARAQRARILGMLLIPLDADFDIPLRRAPNIRDACMHAWGPALLPSVVSLRELLGLIGAYQWWQTGVEIAALKERIHPHYGVFSPVRGEYIELVASAPLPSTTLAFDIGTGTGVLAAVLAKRGVARVIATDLDPRALACARENIERLGLTRQIELLAVDLFPEGRAPLIVCNPPWLPGRPSSPLERAIYDPGSAMLRSFLGGLAAHLEPEGEGWLIMSDFAEHLGLRVRDALPTWIAEAGLRVAGRSEVRPHHPRVSDVSDPLHLARTAEVTSLWRLVVK